MRTLLLAPLILLGACGYRPIADRGPTIPAANVNEAISSNPIGKAEIRVTALWRNKTHSCSLVQLRGKIRAHYHRNHDEVVYIVRGRAWMTTGKVRFQVLAGDCFTIPRGTLHAVEADGYVAAVTLYTPQYDGKDSVFVD